LNFNLLILNISKNNIGDIGCKYLGNYLLNEKTVLESLDISENYLKD